MSIFSQLRRSRQLVKDQKLVEQQKSEAEKMKAPYKHVPTHAATDAFASAPPSWREADRVRIVEQNRRRSAMIASGHHMSMTPLPRVGSSLSHVSYPSDGVPHAGRLPRAYSYTAGSYPMGYGRDTAYSISGLGESHPGSVKGKEVITSGELETQRTSPTFGKVELSPDESSGESTGSRDDLEMRMGRPVLRYTAPDDAPVHKLHPSHSRRASDASTERRAFVNSARTSTQAPAMQPAYFSRDSRPPPSVRGFSSIPLAAEPVPLQLGLLPGPLPPPSFVATSNSSARTPPAITSVQSSSTSLSGLTPTSTAKLPGSAPTTASALIAAQAYFPITPAPESKTTMDRAVDSDTAGFVPISASTAPAKKSDRRSQRITRFTELERIESGGASSHLGYAEAAQTQAAPEVAHPVLVNTFPEPEAQAPPAKGKGKRLIKGGGKLFKRNRLSTSNPVAV